MKAITLWQPWASLIALGFKRYETRSWRAESLIGERIAIHAAKRWPDVSLPLRAALTQRRLDPETLPRGAVVATAELTAIFPTDAVRDGLEDTEITCGDFTNGRYAWQLSAVQRLEPPVPARGRQGVWEWRGSV